MYYLHAFRLREIEADAAFAAVNGYEAATLFGIYRPDSRRGAAPRVALGRLDFDYFGTEIREQYPTHGPGNNLREFNDFDAVKRTGHLSPAFVLNKRGTRAVYAQSDIRSGLRSLLSRFR